MPSLDVIEADLRIASDILEWESGDIFGHVGARLPGGEGVACKAFRPASSDEADWLVHFDYEANKIGGNGGSPREWAIYTEIFRLRPDVEAIAHTHSPACVAMSLADREIMPVHMQSAKFMVPVPIYPRPIHIKDRDEGFDLATALGQGNAVVIKGHGVVTVGKNIDEACMNALYLERTAKIQGLAHALGFTAPTKEFLDDMMESGRRLRAAPSGVQHLAARGGYSNEWTHYKHKLAQGQRWTRGWN